MVDFMVEKWANFATYHDPTPKDQAWPAYGTKDVTYVRLDNSKLTANCLNEAAELVESATERV